MATTDQGRPDAHAGKLTVNYASGFKPAGGSSNGSDWARNLSLILLGAWIAAMIVVAPLLRVGGVVARGNETTWDRAIFNSINAATLTGFQTTMGMREMSAASDVGPALLLTLTLIGMLFSLIVGGLAACRILRMPHTVSQVIWAAVTGVLLATLGGAAALAASSRSVFEAIFQSACAFGNSGLWLGRFPTTTSATTFLVLIPLAVLGGLGLPVLMELTDRIFGGPRLSRHSSLVLKLAGLFYLFALAALILAQAPAAIGGGWPAWQRTLSSCSVAAINTRSAGLPVQSPAAFTAAGQWILMALMLIGAAPAGTAGGLKTTTLWQIGRGIGDILAGRTAHRAFGIAAVWLGIYFLALCTGMLLLISIQPQIPADRLLFLVCSALGNVGLSHDPVSITGPALFVLALLMLFGRIAPLAILWWMAQTTRDADVAVG